MDILYGLIETGKAVIMVTHNYNILKKYPGKVYLFENGTVHEQVDESIELVDL
jgi:ABC-type ATPase involved in cell division